MNNELQGLTWVARLSELPIESPYQVHIGDMPVALYRLPDGIFATEDACSHAFASLCDGWIVGETIECPLHGGAFEIRTGRAVKPPCTEDIRSFPVTVRGDDIYIAI